MQRELLAGGAAYRGQGSLQGGQLTGDRSNYDLAQEAGHFPFFTYSPGRPSRVDSSHGPLAPPSPACLLACLAVMLAVLGAGGFAYLRWGVPQTLPNCWFGSRICGPALPPPSSGMRSTVMTDLGFDLLWAFDPFGRLRYWYEAPSPPPLPDRPFDP